MHNLKYIESKHNDAWTLVKQGESGAPTLTDWINENLPKGAKVGIDPSLISSVKIKLF